MTPRRAIAFSSSDAREGFRPVTFITSERPKIAPLGKASRILEQGDGSLVPLSNQNYHLKPSIDRGMSGTEEPSLRPTESSPEIYVFFVE